MKVNGGMVLRPTVVPVRRTRMRGPHLITPAGLAGFMNTSGIYRVPLGRVVSKYIGDTEKNLRKLIDRAERSNAVLLLDEADALFGRRTDVKDSHDRYANLDGAHLLSLLSNSKIPVLVCFNCARKAKKTRPKAKRAHGKRAIGRAALRSRRHRTS